MNKGKIFFGFILNNLLSLFSYVIPKNQSQFLLGSNVGFVGNPKFFFLYLYQNKKIFCKVNWISKNRNQYNKLKEKNLPVVYLWSFNGFLAVLRSNYLIFSHSISDVSYSNFLLGKFYKINTYHGSSGIKKSHHPKYFHKSLFVRQYHKWIAFRERKSYQLILTCSEKWKLTQCTFPNKNVKILGYPRNDIFFKPIKPFQDYSKKFKLHKFKRVILYAPTWRDIYIPKDPFSKNFLNLLNEYLRMKNFILIIKKHPYSSPGKHFTEFSNIKDYSNKIVDIQDLLINSDVLITDYSSVFVDFCLTGKPIIFYPYDFDQYLEIRGFGLDYFKELPGPFATNEHELFKIIKNLEIITNEENYKKNYLNFQTSFHLFKDGNSSDRLFEYITSNR